MTLVPPKSVTHGKMFTDDALEKHDAAIRCAALEAAAKVADEEAKHRRIGRDLLSHDIITVWAIEAVARAIRALKDEVR